MKSFCLSLGHLATLRETIPVSPHPVDSSGRQKGYSSDDLDSLNEVCAALDTQVGAYRKLRRGVSQTLERQLRLVRKIEDREKRQYREQLATDDAIEQFEAIDAEQDIERRLVVSLEKGEMDWLQENWALRTDWNGADEARERLRAIRSALKDENLIEWKAGEKEPDVAAFDRPKAGEGPPSPNGTVKDAKDLVAV